MQKIGNNSVKFKVALERNTAMSEVVVLLSADRQYICIAIERVPSSSIEDHDNRTVAKGMIMPPDSISL